MAERVFWKGCAFWQQGKVMAIPGKSLHFPGMNGGGCGREGILEGCGWKGTPEGKRGRCGARTGRNCRERQGMLAEGTVERDGGCWQGGTVEREGGYWQEGRWWRAVDAGGREEMAAGRVIQKKESYDYANGMVFMEKRTVFIHNFAGYDTYHTNIHRCSRHTFVRAAQQRLQ